MLPNKSEIRQPRQKIPHWLIHEPLSPLGGLLRDEWMKKACKMADQDNSSRLADAMLLLHSQCPIQPLLPRANARALRWVDSVNHRSQMARRLREVTPNLPWSQRLMLKISQLTLPLAASIVLLLCKSGVFITAAGVVRFADRLARLHIDRHIGPPMA